MKIINKILGTVISVLVAVMVLACCWQVITRFLLNDPSQWTEEFLRYALIWMTMLGAPYAYGKDQHLSIRVLVDKFQSKNQIRTKIAVEIIVLILSIAVFIVGGIMVTANSAGQISAALKLPMQVYYDMYSNQWMSDGAVLFGAFEKMVHRIKGGKINGNSGSNLTCNCIFPDAGI